MSDWADEKAAVIDVENAFMAAVWDALKADASDLRKQARVLDAFRTALRQARADALEEAAREADDWGILIWRATGVLTMQEAEEIARTIPPEIAAAIRSLKDK